MSEPRPWPPELLARVIKAMCPEEVCRICGEPRRPMLDSTVGQYRRLAAHIRERRLALGLTHREVDSWFSGGSKWLGHWESVNSSQPQIPSPEKWAILKERLGLSDEFDEVINRTSGVEYVTEDGNFLEPHERRTTYDRGGGPPAVANRTKAGRKGPDRSTDCGHNDYRPGVVLDPFATATAEVATALGRDAVGIE